MKRVAVLGTGVIGGSIVLRLLSEGYEVTAFDRDPATRRALAGAGDVRVDRSAEEAVAEAGLVIVAVPVDEIGPTLAVIAGSVSAETVVTDVGSAKAGVVETGGRFLGAGFVGGHPMAGSERHGFEAADPTLFEDAWWILTPTRETSETAYNKVTSLVSALGARTVAIDATSHDRLVARLSHLPQLTASTIVHVATSAGDQEALLGLAAGGFRDVTRIAASHPAIWVPILKANRTGVLEALEGFERRLDEVTGLIRDERWDRLGAFLEEARAARAALFARPDHSADPVILTMLVPDRPGLLAEVTTAAGQLGANIEDLKIFHSTEGGRGRLELVITGEAPSEALTRRLEELGYHVERGLPD